MLEWSVADHPSPHLRHRRRVSIAPRMRLAGSRIFDLESRTTLFNPSLPRPSVQAWTLVSIL